MMDWIRKTALALLAGLLIGAGGMYLILSGCEARKENDVLKRQEQDKSEREVITAHVVSGNEQTRRNIQKTMKVIHANTENYIRESDNFIMPAGAVRLHGDAVLQRVSGSSRIIDAKPPRIETGSRK